MTDAIKALLAFFAKLFAKQPGPVAVDAPPTQADAPTTPTQKASGLTAKQIEQCTGARADRAVAFEPHINTAMEVFQINTPMRQAAFLAQIGHESGGLRWLIEIWGPTPAQTRYEGRKDLGNTQAGDGFKYRGRGLIQTTGRANYTATGKALDLDLINNPGLLAQPDNAAMSAGYFWESNGLNQLADTGSVERVTRRVNGGVNGLDERKALYEAALMVLA